MKWANFLVSNSFNLKNKGIIFQRLFCRAGHSCLIYHPVYYVHQPTHNLSSVQFSRSVVSDSLRPHESQHTRPPCPSRTPGVHSDSRPSSQWSHLAISSCRPLLLLPPIPPSISLFQWVNSLHKVAKVLEFQLQHHSLQRNPRAPSEWTGWSFWVDTSKETAFAQPHWQEILANTCQPIGYFLPSFLVAQMVKHLPTMQETQLRFLGWEDLLEKEMATHSGTLAWKIPWTEECCRLQPMGSQRLGHDWATLLSLLLSFQWLRFSCLGSGFNPGQGTKIPQINYNVSF